MNTAITLDLFMSLLARLFKGKTSPTVSLEDRVAALSELDDNSLLNTARSDDSETLRIAAIALLPFSSALRELALTGNSPDIQRAAQVRLGELFEAKQVELGPLTLGITNTSQQLLLTQFSPGASLEVIGKIDDQQALLELAVSATVASVRQAAANKVLGSEALSQLLKSSKGKDKAVYKLVKTKLDAQKEQQAQAAEIQAAIDSLCDSTEQMSRTALTPLFAAKISALEARWSKLVENADEPRQARFKQALQACQQVITDHHDSLNAEANKASAELEAANAKQQLEQEQQSQQQQAQQALEQQLCQDLAVPSKQIQALLAELYAAEIVDADLATRLETALKLSRNSIDDMSPEVAQLSPVKNFNRFGADVLNTIHLCAQCGSLQQLTAQLLQDESSEDNASSHKECATQLQNILRSAQYLEQAELPAAVSAAQQSLSNYKQQQQQLKQKQDSQRRQLSELLRRGLHAVEDNNLRRVAGISRDVEKLVAEAGQLPNGLASKVEDLATGLAKLRDWHSFATEPKKQELVAKMEGLVGSNMHPKDLANLVQRLQEEWKTLSKGGKNQDEELWQRFQDAANKAYEPCHEHFGEQAKLREDNLLKRRNLLEQLQSYIDGNSWDSADWQDSHCKDVEQLRQLAREEWRRYSPVARSAHQELQQTFDQRMDFISESISAFYQRGKEQKAAFIQQAQQLTDLDDTRKAIDGIKGLQAKWKAAGRCGRKDDQQLWAEFRSHCDAVFNRREQESNQQQQAFEANQAAAEPILSALEQLLALNGQEFLQAAQQLSELSEQFHAVGELPRASRGQLNSRFRQLSSDINNKVSSERQNIKDQAWQVIFDASDAVRQYEWQQVDQAAAQAEIDRATEKANSQTKDALQSIQQRFENPALTAQQQQANSDSLQLLCIRAEILSGAETPADNKAARMDYQMKQLKQGLGQADSDTIEQFTMQWLATGATLASDYDALCQRFELCRQAKS